MCFTVTTMQRQWERGRHSIKGTSSPLYSNFDMWSNPLDRHVILHYTIPKPYIHWKGMLSSRNQCRSCAAACHLKTITFQCIYGFVMLWPRINGIFDQFRSEGKIACQGGAGTLKHFLCLLWYWSFSTEYCGVPGSSCLSKIGPAFVPSFICNGPLARVIVHLFTD